MSGYLQSEKVWCNLRLEVSGNCSSYKISSHCTFKNKSAEAYHYRVYQINYLLLSLYIHLNNSLLWYTMFWVSASPGRYNPCSIQAVLWKESLIDMGSQNKQTKIHKSRQNDLQEKGSKLLDTVWDHVPTQALHFSNRKTSLQHHGSFPTSFNEWCISSGIKIVGSVSYSAFIKPFACCLERAFVCWDWFISSLLFDAFKHCFWGSQ